MSSYTLSAQMRDKTKKPGSFLKEGFIPALLYGPGIETQLLKVNAKEFTTLFQETGTSQIITLHTPKGSFSVLVHDIQRDPLTDAFIHADFYSVTKGHKVSTPIPLIFIGTSGGVKDKGGTLVTHIREVEVEAIPEKLPASLEVNLSRLQEFGDEVLVGDLVIPEGVSVLIPLDVVIVSLLVPRKEIVPEKETSKTSPPTTQVDQSKE